MTDFAITADARKVTSREFLSLVTGFTDEVRAARREETRQQCIRAIGRGNTYGFPPSLVAECRAIMASQDQGKL